MNERGMNGNIYVPVYRRWWFWACLAAAAVPAFYFAGYLDWRGEQAPYSEYARMTAEYVTQQKAQSAALEKAYREDSYGGATPEETLKLYVEALEKGDFEEASRYFAVEKQSDFLEVIKKANASGGAKKFIETYRTGLVSYTIFDSGDVAEADVIPKGEQIGFGVRFVLNPFTKKWKLTEL